MKNFQDFKDYLRFLWLQRVTGFEVSHVPHMDEETLAWFTERLSICRFYLEYGSGGSTILADSMGVQTLSVESDRYFARAVREQVSSRCTILTPDIGLTREWGTPVSERPSQKWWRYVYAPYDNRQFSEPDLVLVDGRFRVACALAAAISCYVTDTPVDILIDDYEGRPHYNVVESVLGTPMRIGRSALFSVDVQRSWGLQHLDIRKHLNDFR